MIWLIGNKGMLGSEIARQFEENKIDEKEIYLIYKKLIFFTKIK